MSFLADTVLSLAFRYDDVLAVWFLIPGLQSFSAASSKFELFRQGKKQINRND